jgi:hypothetical protein
MNNIGIQVLLDNMDLQRSQEKMHLSNRNFETNSNSYSCTICLQKQQRYLRLS